MKYLIVFIAFCLISCTSKYYQIHTTSSNNVVYDYPNNRFFYEDRLVTINYNLWNNGGSIWFSIYNNTDSVLYVDWNKSNFIFNGYSYDYLNSTAKMSTVSGSTYKNGYLLANSVTYLEEQKQQVQLPPKSYIVVHRFNLNAKSNLTSKESEVKEYLQSNSYLNFRNYLAISKNQDYTNPFFIDNTFWVSKSETLNKSEFKKVQNFKTNSFYNNKNFPNKKKTVGLIGAITIVVLLLL